MSVKQLDRMNIYGGWMTCNFTSFLTVFQSYQDNGRVIINDRMQWNLVHLDERTAPHTAAMDTFC